MAHPLDIIGLKKHAGLHGPTRLTKKTRPALQNVTEGDLLGLPFAPSEWLGEV